MTNNLRQSSFQTFEKTNKQDPINLLTISAIWIVMAFLANPIGNFPLNDDWVYALAVKSLLENGYYYFPSPASANVGPQVYWGALFCIPFGFSFTALRFSTLLIGLLGILALYQLIRTLDSDQRTALIGSLALAVNPLYFGLSNSYMTDIPFIALVIISIYFLAQGIKSNSRLNITIGIITAITAILVRQLGLLILLGFAFAYPTKCGFNFKNILKVFGLVVLGALVHITYQAWLVNTGRTPVLSGHSNIQTLIPNKIGIWGMKEFSINALAYIGFFLIPLLPLFIQRKPISFNRIELKTTLTFFLGFSVAFLGLLLWKGHILPSLTNVLIKSGLGPLTLRDTFILNLNNPAIPQSLSIFWGGMTVLAAAAASAVICCMGLATKQFIIEFRSAESLSRPWAFSFIVTMGCAYFSVLVFIAGGYLSVFDRYLLPLLPIVILFVTNIKFEQQLPRGNSGMTLSVAFIILYAGFSVAATHDYLSWNRTRWVALDNLLADNTVRPNQVDGGYEFNGMFLYDPKYKKIESKSWWWVDDDQYIVASGPLPNYTEYRRYSFNRWLTFSESNILVLRKNSQP